jgi:hypothetical protein
MMRGSPRLIFAEILYQITRAVEAEPGAILASLSDFSESATEQDFLRLVHPHRALLEADGIDEESMVDHVRRMLQVLPLTVEARLSMLLLPMWGRSLYPQIVVGHKYAAALVSTRLSRDVLSDLEVPFRSFQIQVPADLLTVISPDGVRESISIILVGRYQTESGEDRWGWCAYSDGGTTLYQYGHTTEQILKDTRFPFREDAGPFEAPLMLEDDRSTTLINRLILSLCLAMTNREDVKPIGAGHRRYGSSALVAPPRPAVLPVLTARTFQVGRPIKHDVRAHVQSFVRGERSSLSVRSVVCGHFKPRLAARTGKIVWVEPYVRGPTDGPILLRPRIVGEP